MTDSIHNNFFAAQDRRLKPAVSTIDRISAVGRVRAIRYTLRNNTLHRHTITLLRYTGRPLCYAGPVVTLHWACHYAMLGLPLRYTGPAITVHWACNFATLDVPLHYTGRTITLHWACHYATLGLQLHY